MKRIWIAALCLLLLSGCGKAPQGATLHERYAAVSGAEIVAEITVHLPDETRQYQVNCDYDAENGAEVVVTSPPELAGLQVTVSPGDLTLSYDDMTLSAGSMETVTPANCLPWLLRAAASGYVLEEGRETLGDRECLRMAFDTTGADGKKVLCTAWFDRETLSPIYSEFSLNGELQITVKVISFTEETEATQEP
ncbi:MAG: hypothetical protein II458_01485 [Oscillospiraceae bacterium]|nr:hypothetical protein [Oscillospiraceae bacterium]